jgi:hypothetical protein
MKTNKKTTQLILILLLVSFGLVLISYYTIGDKQTACTEEAKLCPDGTTSVGRTGPNCEFEACPGEDGERVYCTEEQRNVDACIEIYQPVCGWSKEEIKCLVYPCASTYSNSCFACMDENVAYWTVGECPEV